VPAAVPDAPTAVSATVGNGSASVAFTAPAANGSAITGYTVTATDTTTPANGGQTASGASSPITVGGLTNGDAYTFTVTATNGVGTGAASTASAAVTPSTVPDPLTNFTAVPGNHEITFSWTYPTNDGGSPLVGAVVATSDQVILCEAAYPATTCTVTGLDNGTTVVGGAVAVNQAGSLASPPTYSTPVTFGATPSTVPDTPTGATATAGIGSASVAFTAPAANGSAITSYTVTANDTTTPANGGQTATGASSPITVGGLTNGDAYTFTVKATNGDGAGAASSPSNSVVPSSNSATITSAASVTIAAGKELKLIVTTGGTPKATVHATGVPAWMTFTPGATKGTAGTARVAGVGPAGGGVYTLTVHANNGSGPDTTQVVTVHVLGFSSGGAASFTKGVAGSVTITTTGGLSGVVLTSSLPAKLAGLTFHDNGDGTATLSGTPGSKDASSTITVKAAVGTTTTSMKLVVGIG